MPKHSGWIGVDLDGTLAYYDKWNGAVGEPITPMVERVQRWLKKGHEVRIVTARASDPKFVEEGGQELIELWCEKHIGRRLVVTCTKDYQMIELWDDRAIQILTNTGVRVGRIGSRVEDDVALF